MTEIHFVELMRTGTERALCESEYVSIDEVREHFAEQSVDASPVGEERCPARASIVEWRGAEVQVGWISPRSHPFCESCERLRMDARGRVRRCLMDPRTLDLPALLRSSGGEVTQRSFEHYIGRKLPPLAMDTTVAMSEIGG